jgi:hypothetical protein
MSTNTTLERYLQTPDYAAYAIDKLDKNFAQKPGHSGRQWDNQHLHKQPNHLKKGHIVDVSPSLTSI